MRHIHFLSLLVTCDDEQRAAMIKTMNMQQFKILVECIHNILYGVISISSSFKKNLAKHKTIIRKITDANTTRHHRKQLVLKYRFLLPGIIRVVLQHIKNDERNDTDSETEI